MKHTLFTLPSEGSPCKCCKEAAHATLVIKNLKEVQKYEISACYYKDISEDVM